MNDALTFHRQTQTGGGLSALQRWRPTMLLLQTLITAALGVLIAVLARRVDLLVLATPFVVVLVWMLAARPNRNPHIDLQISPLLVHEGQSSRWTATLSDLDGVDQIVGMVRVEPMQRAAPAHGELIVPISGDNATVSFDIQNRRWGTRRVGDAALTLVGPWNGFRLGPIDITGTDVRTTPAVGQFDLAATAPHPEGLVGPNRSRRQGNGTEFADIRQFRVGDRLRHIHWPVSARTGELHVRTMYAEQDAEVHLVLDATVDVGTSGGVDGSDSSLDKSVRAAAALAHHLLRRGERVALTAYAEDPVLVPTGLGQRQQRRILDSLAGLRPGHTRARAATRPALRASSGALVLVLTPLVAREGIDQVLRLIARGHTVVVVDCLPPDVEITGAQQEPSIARAWRLRLLERDLEISRLGEHGIPVVPWRGPGSLDEVLRRMAARPRPRLVRR